MHLFEIEMAMNCQFWEEVLWLNFDDVAKSVKPQTFLP